MTTWREKFIVLEQCLPDAPEDDVVSTSIHKKISSISNILYEYQEGPLLLNDEPKIIIKVPATPYQKSKFNENYTFRFQSLLTGRVSQFIPYVDRKDCEIEEDDKLTGGIYPSEFNFTNNVAVVREYYWDIRKRLMNEYWKKFSEYLRIVGEVKGEWWELYTAYLKSEEWLLKREYRMNIDNNRCYVCNSDYILQVHHMHYKNVGDEFMEDLITVCINCHQKLHPYKKII